MRVLLYLLVGIIVSVIYTPLAGGSSDHFVLTVWVGPIAALAALIALAFYRSERRERARNERYSVQDSRNWFSRHGWGIFFWSLVIWVSLPVLFNQGSHLVRWMGYPGFGDLLFAFRYSSLFLSGGASLLLAILVGRIVNEFVAFRRRAQGWQRKPPVVSS